MMVRTALAAGDSGLATRLTQSVQANYPLSRHALAAARAHLAEGAALLETVTKPPRDPQQQVDGGTRPSPPLTASHAPILGSY